MSDKQPIERLTIRGFKSIRALEAFPLRDLNVLIGANGAGKSNFVSYFHMLREMIDGRLRRWTAKQGTADRIVFFGVQETVRIESSIEFRRSLKNQEINARNTNDKRIVFTDVWGKNKVFLELDEDITVGDTPSHLDDNDTYAFHLETIADGRFIFFNEGLLFSYSDQENYQISLGDDHQESRLKETHRRLKYTSTDAAISDAISRCYNSMLRCQVYHFHDTSETAGMRRIGAVHDNAYLRPDGSNLAAFLYRLSEEHPNIYQRIRTTINLAMPFFEDFVFQPRTLPTEEQLINLQWRQKDSDYPFWPSQLSDGSIRFICLVTALLQPDPPATIIIDEPELGLHPYAITMLGSLLQLASTTTQVIIATQSVSLVDQFDIEDLIIVERRDGESVFSRPNEEDFNIWLEEYSVGELWEKNVLGGRPYS